MPTFRQYCSRVRPRILWFLCVFLLLLGAVHNVNAQINVLTRHYDNYRTGVNLNETILNASNVNQAQFGKLFSRAVDGEIYAQPLYVSNLALPGKGTHNVVFVATAHNSIYAFDADDPTQNDPLWHVNLGASVPSIVIGTPNLPVEVGLISTPVIDLSTGTLYAVTKNYENSVQLFRLHALSLTTGAEKFGGPMLINGSVPGTGDGNDGNGNIPFLPYKQNQRVALTLANGNIYVGFASHEDNSPYHGWIFAYDKTTLAKKYTHNNTPNGWMGGIWMSGEGFAVDDNGSLYYVGGNGAYDGVTNFGQSVVKLNPNLTVANWFTPYNYDFLNSIDYDLGTANAILIPGNKVLAGGKEGVVYVLDRTNMGRFNAGGDQIPQRWGATNGHIHSSMIYWHRTNADPLLFVWGENDVLKAFPYQNGNFVTTPSQTSTMQVYPGYANGPAMTLSSNNNASGSAILFVSLPYDGDAVHDHVNGIFRAFDANDVSRELWNSRVNLDSDDSGVWAKWTPPVVANGKVYMASFSGVLNVYGLLPQVPPAAPINLTATAGNGLVFLLWNATPHAASYTLKRSLTNGGPYTTVAAGLTSPTSTDFNVVNGTTYYYVVSASNVYGEGLNSNQAQARPDASIRGNTLSVSFVGFSNAMQMGEVAGVVPAANWNNAPDSNGTLLNLIDNLGSATGISVQWNCNNVWGIGLTDVPGNVRMMNGYLDSTDTSTTTVTVSGIPPWLAQNGYDVYVYTDGGGIERTGDYTLGNQTIQARDLANFNGTFTEAMFSVGNYVVFPELYRSSFTLSARASVNGGFRAPVNAIQLVALTPGSGTGLLGHYFNDPADGTHFNTPIFDRVDKTINFDWGGDAPGDGVQSDNFSIRWTGQIQPQFTENYTFTTRTDDGVRCWVNNTLVVDAWYDQAPTEHSGALALIAGKKYDIRMEYYERGGGAVGQLFWASPSTPRQIVPRSALFNTADLSGIITLGGVPNVGSAVVSPGLITFQFRPIDGSPTLTRTAALAANGAYTVVSLPQKDYSVWIKGTKWLAKAVPINLTNGSLTLPAVALAAGDANNDNTVDIADLLILLSAYNRVSPNAGYRAAADFNCDGANDIADLLLLIGNYNQVGD